MTKFLNAPADALTESLEGFALAHAGEVRLNAAPRYVRRAHPNRAKVALIAGGGSGHEPLHAGFVGAGMLDAAVPGEVFTSPAPDQIIAAADAVSGDAGALFIVKNYSGDVMNFELAMELHAGASRRVLVEDDVAVDAPGVGRRGVAGTLVVEKIVGAAAERGADLDACAALGDAVAAATRSMGVALGGCRVPTSDRPNLELAPGEMEIGVGIHGEPGLRRAAAASAAAVIDEIGGHVLDDLGAARGEPVLLFVNGFGGTPLMELYILHREACRLLADRGLVVARALVGNYVTSLEMPGASVTVTRLGDRFAELWDAPVRTPALRWGA
ncbi:MAG: dihydroxyacetone kinase subunit DhaK [Sphingomonas sp.]